MGWPEQNVEQNPLQILLQALWAMTTALFPKPRVGDGALTLALEEAER